VAILTRPTAGLDRREFLAITAGSLALSGWIARAAPQSAAPRRVQAIAFDGFTIFDPRPISALAETLFPGKGPELSNAWRTRQFEYQWLRALSGRYADFLRTTEEALVFAARSLRLDLAAEKRARLMQAYLELKAWPDVPASLRSLKEAGIRLSFLSNMTGRMLKAGIENSGLEGAFDDVLSTDDIKTYKPDPRAYRMAIDSFHLEREAILFAPFAGWDAAGARWFGYPTFWVNRLDLPSEELGVTADAVGHDLGDLAGFVRSQRST
jgi:2-haloacid dehalogenase